METLKSIVLMIDADNTQLSKIENVIQEVSTYGRIVVKRAYGNWKKEALKNWENELKRLAIKAEQQFDYVSGKNATDIALVIDAINLLHKGIYDAFVIVASDSDYTPLAISLHESGVYVIGIGENKTPKSFRNSCDEFIFLENIGVEKETAVAEEPSASESVTENSKTKVKKHENINEIHNLLRIAFDKFQINDDDTDNYVNIASAGQFIRRAKPDFDVRNFGFEKLSKLIEAFPEKYELKNYEFNGKKQIGYKCKKGKSRGKKK
ncbi:MAG: NYN domain-containing protein [Acidaminococcaceae bacterium]|nr:NYN domain-containing protein [Acidaminococcaceae bacterium]